MKHRFQGIFIGFVLAILVLGGTSVLATQITRTIEVIYGVNIVMNGVSLNFSEDMQPFVSGGRTYVSVRALAEALGLYVKWDRTTNTAYLSCEPFTEPGLIDDEPSQPTLASTDVEQSIFGSWQFYSFTAAYPQLSADSYFNTIWTFSDDGILIIESDDDILETVTFEVIGNRIIYDFKAYADDLTVTFEVNGDALTIIYGIHFTRTHDGGGFDPIFGRWQSTTNDTAIFEIIENGVATMEIPGEPIIHMEYDIYENLLILVWDYGMMVYTIVVCEDNLSLIFMTIVFTRVE